MPTNLRMREADWIAVRKHCRSSFRPGFPPETGVIGIVGESTAGNRRDFLVTQLLWPQDGDLAIAEHGALVFSASYLRRAHLLMRESKLAGLVVFHTHPLADEYVQFSAYDDECEPDLVENLQELEPGTRLVSVVLGKRSQCGRVWVTDEHFRPLESLISVGERLVYAPLSGRPQPAPPSPAAIFDRGLALTSAGALALLGRLTVAVIGASGTGTLVCELLARAGCGRILLIDYDIVTLINLNRMLYATLQDAKDGVPKVEVVWRRIRETSLDCSVEPVRGSVLEHSTLARVRDADAIIGCVDRAFPRHVASEFAYQYLLPYIDIGSEIGGDERGIVSLDARVSYVTPSRPCLSCTGIVTPRQLHFESLSAGERARHAGLGYSDDLLVAKPAVMDLNMRAASMGTMLLRHLLQPFLLEPLPVSFAENLVTSTSIRVARAKAEDPACPTCRANPYAGFGDCGPQLGLDSSVVSELLEDAALAAE